MIQVQPYQARIPITGGGGLRHIDLREGERPNPIAQALERIIERRRQSEQDELARQKAEMAEWKVFIDNGKTILYNMRTGEKKDTGIPAPKGKVEGRAIASIINDMAKLSGAAKTVPEEVLGTPTIRAGLRSLEDEVTRKAGLPTPRRKPLIEGEPIKRGITAPPEEHAAWHEGAAGLEIPERKKVKAREMKGKVRMKAPDGKNYEVPRSEVEEAKKHGWKVL